MTGALTKRIDRLERERGAGRMAVYVVGSAVTEPDLKAAAEKAERDLGHNGLVVLVLRFSGGSSDIQAINTGVSRAA